MTNFNEEALAKAKQAKSVEELLTLAKESDVEMTAEQAQEIFARLNQKSGELSDDELDNVAGGGCYNYNVAGNVAKNSCDLWVCMTCGGTETFKRMSRRAGGTFEICANCGSTQLCSTCKYCFIQSNTPFCTNPGYSRQKTGL